MKYFILFILISCSTHKCYDGELAAAMFASGAIYYCQEVIVETDHYNEKEYAKCEDLYWDSYCDSNVGEPDLIKCKEYWKGYDYQGF